ncbi:MAG TPA: choice-of-anchor Q domain-containing protein [Acidimicrobiales bacterium]|nr:choice-of-anchor Q domain-containing protein [Acidimicrobiales bacterium]
MTSLAHPTVVGTRVLYAYATGVSAVPGCPPEHEPAQGCSLAQALAEATAGDTVALATPGRDGHFVGNWTIATAGTSSRAPVTIAPAPEVAHPVLDGNEGGRAGCRTATCDGSVLSIGHRVHVVLKGLTISNAVTDGAGGGAQNDEGGTLVVLASTFSDDNATDGGAIANGDNAGAGTLIVSGSTFSANIAEADGGAIDSADNRGEGALSVSGSKFSGNSADGNGGAIDNGDNAGNGQLSVSASTFADDQSDAFNTSDDTFVKNPGDGGAIDNGDHDGQGHLSVSASTFSANSSYANGINGDAGVGGNGGAIDNGDNGGQGTLLVSRSTLVGNIGGHGGAINNSDSLSVSSSTFSTNIAGFGGGAIDNGRAAAAPCACASIWTSTFTNNLAGGQSSDGPFEPAWHDLPQGLAFIAANGGAIDNGDGDAGTLEAWSSTFSGNQAFGDGDTIDAGDLGGQTGAGAIWVAANIFDGGCHKVGGTWHDLGYNVGDDRTCLRGTRGDVSHGASSLAGLAANGGPTQTMSPLARNPALGAVPFGTAFSLGGRRIYLCPATDQRGVRSAPGRACDAGAVQVRAAGGGTP